MGSLLKLRRYAVISSVLAVYCNPGSANVQNWTFDKSTQSITKVKGAGKSLNLTSADGVRLKISGLSDTKERKNGDETIQRGKLSWASDTALGMRNKGEKSKDEVKGESRYANRGIDSIVTRTKSADGQYDMLQLEFDTAVSLDGLTLDWAKGGDGTGKTADISILADTGDGSSDLRKNTWAQILGSGDGNGFDLVGNYSNVGLSYYAVNPGTVTSKRWLIGVYNPVFGAGGDAGDDAFRLASIQTSGPTTLIPQEILPNIPDDIPHDVPIPGTLTLLLTGLLSLRLRRETGAPH